MQPAAPNKTILFSLALVKFLIPFILIHPAFELQRDEFLYYQQGQHLDFGYMENPPLLSYLGRVSSWLGNKEWLIRFWPGFFGAVTVVITCLITARLGGKGLAQAIAGTGIITGAYLRIHILYQPNILDIFFWSCSLYFLVRFIQANHSKDFLYMAVCLALGMWSKYSIAFLIISVFTGLVLTRQRKVFLQRNFYSTIVIALVIILPNIWWQYTHRWPLVHHMRELRETQLVHVNPLDFIKEQFLILLPAAIVWIAGLTLFFRNSSYRIFAWIYLTVILLFLFGSGKSYYTLGVYPVLLAAGGVLWEKISFSRKWVPCFIMVLVSGLTILFVPIALPMMSPEKLASFYKKYQLDKTGLLRWEDQRNHSLPQDFADMLGWKELAEKAEKFYHSLPDTTGSNTIIYCRNYGQAGALKYYGKDRRFKAVTISDNGSFLLWVPGRLWFKNLLFIGRRMPDQEDEVFQHFEKVSVVDSVTDKFSRQYRDKIIFFENIDSAGLQLARKALEEMKAGFIR